MSIQKVKETLSRLAIREDQFRTLGLTPLVEVAWAEGNIDSRKRAAIQKFAKQKGWLSDGGDALLEGWLKQRPKDEFFEDTRNALILLVQDRRGMGAAFSGDTLADVLSGCHDVAAASGGFFGFKDPITPEEDKVLARLSEAFELGAWKEAVTKHRETPPADIPGPEGHFLLGSIPDFNKDALGFVISLARDHGDVSQIKLGPIDAIVLSHPEAIKHVFLDNHRNYKLSPAVEDAKVLLGDGLLTTEGEGWKTHRRMIQPAFHMDKLAAMVDSMTRIAAEELNTWPNEKNEPVNVMDKFMQLTLRLATECLFGMDVDQDAKEVLGAANAAIEYLNNRSRQLIKLPISLPSEANRNFVKAKSVLDETIFSLVRARREGKSPQKADVLQLLLDARDEETGKGLSEKELRDELLTMMAGGTETTALAMTWAASFLSMHPGIRRQAQEEVARVMGDRIPTFADTKQLPLVRQILDETLRLRSPLYGSARMAIGEDTVMGVKIKPGTMVVANIYGMHRNPRVWPNPEGFDPERFSPEASKDRHSCAFVPFLTGPKKCIGMNFALLEMQLIFPMVLQRFDLDLLPGKEPIPYPSLTLRPKDGCWMDIKQRQKAS